VHGNAGGFVVLHGDTVSFSLEVYSKAAKTWTVCLLTTIDVDLPLVNRARDNSPTFRLNEVHKLFDNVAGKAI